MIEKINNEKLAHNFFFLTSLLILPFVGFALDKFNLVFIGIGLSVILKLFLSCDIRLLFIDLILPFITARREFSFGEFPTTLVFLAAILILGLILMPFKHMVVHGKPKLETGLMTNSFIVIGLVMFISPIVRNLLYNVPAFPEYSGGYNILFGYGGGIICLILPLIFIAISTFKTNDKSPIPNLMYLLALFLIFELYYTILIEGKTFDDAFTTSGTGWGNKNAFMIILELTIPFTAYIFSKNWKRIDSLALFITSITIGLASDSRAGQITLICAIPFLIYLCAPKIKHYKTSIIITYVACTIIGLVSIFTIDEVSQSIKRLYETIFHNDSFTSVVTGRDIFWEWISTYVLKNPKHFLFGGSFSYLFEMFQAFNHTDSVDLWLAHNSFMTFLAAGGVLGLLALFYHYIDIFVAVIRNKNTHRLLLLTFLLIGFVHGLGDNTLFNIQFMLPYVFVLQDVSRINKIDEKELI